MAEKMQLQGLSDEILTEKVNVLERMKLKGLDTIKEFSDEMLKWDPRIALLKDGIIWSQRTICPPIIKKNTARYSRQI